MTSKHIVLGLVRRVPFALASLLCAAVALGARPMPIAAQAHSALEQIGIDRGICVLLGLPEGDSSGFVSALAENSELTFYFQSADQREVAGVRQEAEAAGVLGSRVFVDRGDWSRVHLADNLAGAVLVSASARGKVSQSELKRVLHPRGKAVGDGVDIVKPFPEETDSWSHPYHGPDNNPQSTDGLARAPYLTQFLADPKFCPMPEVSVAAGGRVFRAFGHIAHKANQNAMLNTLICVNAFNGTILWQRELPEGFMIHRNTMVATPELLYLADHRSCKRIDAATGELVDEIVVPDRISDGPVWKWMALADGVLYALVGNEEIEPETQRSRTPGLGHWPWGMWTGHDYDDPKTNFGFGRTFVAIDVSSKQVLWNQRQEQYADSRGVCMRGGRIYFYCPDAFLGCLDTGNGQVAWKNSDADLLEAIGSSGRAQHYVTGYATTTYIKATDDYILFAGPQRNHLVAARAEDGKLLWQKEHGNFQLVLRDDAVYAAGPQGGGSHTGVKLAYESGEVLDNLPMRRACTRATGTEDSVFFRASGGTVRIDLATNNANHIAPMRPPCQSGVIISDGNLYWGPWMCGCQLSLYGHICLTSGGEFNYRPGLDQSRLETSPDSESVEALEIRPGDWPTYQGDAQRSSTAGVTVPGSLKRGWEFDIPSDGFPTAPVAAGGLVFFGDRNGVVRAVDANSGGQRWAAYTGSAIFVSPAIEEGRLFVGSADGHVYAFEATTGRRLWTFRAAPAQRWIPVYGKLMSTWPVAGGVAVQDGVVYAAAGIAHYDGTHVYALDAGSGKVKWYNDTSGATSEVANHGVSLQGELYIRDGELRFIGGGVHEEARYDLRTGRCLNQPTDEPRSSFHTSFYAYFPDYGKYDPLDCTLEDGTSLCYDCTYEGSWHGKLMLLPALPAEAQRPHKPASRWGVQRRRDGADAVWQHPPARRFNAFIVGQDVLLAAGHMVTETGDSSFLCTVKIEDGSPTWGEQLAGPVVKGGLAIDHQQRLFVSMKDGRILGFKPAD